ncbi:MAG: amino-acid racemase [Candidatus Cloacimonetes bacterium HGW-Cloacimonetes-3]|jgi:predicted amino acid racemase|nr:MAG: amino-acid racemase [Candidatus Cloacimonetes bacterium HGW-Cloacimonetes-3]
MAQLKIHLDRIVANIEKIDVLMRENAKEWSLVVKVLGNHRETLSALLNHPAILKVHSVAVSQWKILKMVKEINPQLRTMYIKPPSISNADKVVRYADISVNSSLLTIQALNEAAQKRGVIHKIIIMIEMGELREGIKREGLLDFYRKVFDLPHIEVIGLGTNLGCMTGVKPTYDKLLQLVLYEQLIEAVFNRKLELISGASSITLPQLKTKKIPEGINHFRIGEAAFLGTSPLQGKQFLGLNTDAFTFEANIVELYRKENSPDGVLSDAGVGDFSIDGKSKEGSSYRAILDFGILDVDTGSLISLDDSVKFFGNSSDLTVFDLGENPSHFETGDVLRFKPKYMDVARLMGANFVEKKILGI